MLHYQRHYEPHVVHENTWIKAVTCRPLVGIEVPESYNPPFSPFGFPDIVILNYTYFHGGEGVPYDMFYFFISRQCDSSPYGEVL